MEDIIKILIYIHAFFGGVGLITGLTIIFFKKGNLNHKRLGSLFSWSMIISSLISLIVARMPHHENTFLFLIGIFTIYMVMAGNRALTFKSTKKAKANLTDKLVSIFMIASALIMVGFGIIGLVHSQPQSILFIFFGGAGLFLTYGDFKLFANTLVNRKLWLINHLSRMLGAFIASITAFLVAGMKYDNLWAWMLPRILGNIYISYLIRKTKSKIQHKKA